MTSQNDDTKDGDTSSIPESGRRQFQREGRSG